MAMLEVLGLRKEFGGVLALKDLDFSLQEGEILGLIGPNGAGKTTAFNLISGFLRPSAGKIHFRGDNIVRLEPHQICFKGITRTFQIVQPFSTVTVLENVMIGAFSKHKRFGVAKKKALEVLHSVGLLEVQDQEAGSLPIASQKRLELAKALATEPKLLLLDEVMAGLTATEITEVLSIIKRIRESGVTLLLIEHVMHAIMSVSDRILVLHHGEKIAEGKPQEVSKDKKVMDAYLGEDFVLYIE
jgi:branched-chain amino acid transport system ATP-binding protein